MECVSDWNGKPNHWEQERIGPEGTIHQKPRVFNQQSDIGQTKIGGVSNARSPKLPEWNRETYRGHSGHKKYVDREWSVIQQGDIGNEVSSIIHNKCKNNII